MLKKKCIQSYQDGPEESTLCDVKAAVLGQDLNVLDLIVEPVENE